MADIDETLHDRDLAPPPQNPRGKACVSQSAGQKIRSDVTNDTIQTSKHAEPTASTLTPVVQSEDGLGDARNLRYAALGLALVQVGDEVLESRVGKVAQIGR